MSRSGRRTFEIILSVLAVFIAAAWATPAGELEPPGPPYPTMKNLSAVEPRIPIYPGTLPLVITTPGTYYLVGDLVTPGAGITIDSDYVTIDLMGFRLSGGTGNGISVISSRIFIAVRNGVVSDWSQHGLDLGERAFVDNIRAESNLGNGIQVSNYSQVTNSIGDANMGHGIVVGAQSVVSRCKATTNGENGIWATSSSMVVDSLAAVNGRSGIRVDSWCMVARNSSTFSDSNMFTGGAGIWVTGSDNRIEDNHLVENNWGIRVDGNDNVIARNIVAKSGSINFDIAPWTSGNLCDVRSDLSGAGPWSNFSK
jgi:parallel beta-helix repeat protein